MCCCEQNREGSCAPTLPNSRHVRQIAEESQQASGTPLGCVRLHTIYIFGGNRSPKALDLDELHCDDCVWFLSTLVFGWAFCAVHNGPSHIISLFQFYELNALIPKYTRSAIYNEPSHINASDKDRLYYYKMTCQATRTLRDIE